MLRAGCPLQTHTEAQPGVAAMWLSGFVPSCEATHPVQHHTKPQGHDPNAEKVLP
jgi:hypothetical protein